MQRLPYEEDEVRTDLSEEEKQWAKELADLIFEAGMSDYYAYVLKQKPHSYLSNVPEESKGPVYYAAVQLMQSRVDQQNAAGSESIH